MLKQSKIIRIKMILKTGFEVHSVAKLSYKFYASYANTCRFHRIRLFYIQPYTSLALNNSAFNSLSRPLMFPRSLFTSGNNLRVLPLGRLASSTKYTVLRLVYGTITNLDKLGNILVEIVKVFVATTRNTGNKDFIEKESSAYNVYNLLSGFINLVFLLQIVCLLYLKFILTNNLY